MMSSIGLLAVVAAVGVGIGIALLKWPEIGTLMAAAVLYMNLIPIAVRLHGVPAVAAVCVVGLVVPPLVQQLLLRRERVVLDRTLLLMIVFLLCVIVSSTVAVVRNLALVWIAKYIGEAVIIYFLFVNLIRTKESLRHLAWLLVVIGAFLATLTVYQELTGSYHNQFGGLAGRNLEMEVEGGPVPGSGASHVRLANRAQGPIDDPNRYAQLLIVLVPLAWCLFRTSAKPWQKWLALGATGVIGGGMLLTYSRGGFVGLVLTTALMAVLRTISLRQIGAALLAGALAVTVLNPGYLVRMQSLLGVAGLFSGSSDSAVSPDAVERGRATHMLAAWRVFLDHPIIGTGPGQFSSVYSVDYSNDLYSVRRVTEPRRAHCLYLELAAETGVVGFGMFLTIVVAALLRLLEAWRLARDRDPYLTNMILASVASLFAYLFTAMFLQLSYQRYFWFLMAFAGATVHITQVSMLGARAAAEPLVRSERAALRLQEIGPASTFGDE